MDKSFAVKSSETVSEGFFVTLNPGARLWWAAPGTSDSHPVFVISLCLTIQHKLHKMK